jgi:hypothetical protein
VFAATAADDQNLHSTGASSLILQER